MLLPESSKLPSAFALPTRVCKERQRAFGGGSSMMAALSHNPRGAPPLLCTFRRKIFSECADLWLCVQSLVHCRVSQSASTLPSSGVPRCLCSISTVLIPLRNAPERPACPSCGLPDGVTVTRGRGMTALGRTAQAVQDTRSRDW